jgi:hypothetical protein
VKDEQLAKLRLLRGGRGPVRVGRLMVTVAPAETPPFPVAATVLEEDTWLVLSAPPEIRPPAEHPLRLFTELITAEPLAPGSVVVENGEPLRLLAVVYDLGAEPSCRPEWVTAALAELIRAAAERKLASLALPLLGVRHGRLPLAVFVSLFVLAIREGAPGSLKKVWLAAPAEMAAEVRRLLGGHSDAGQ